MRGSDDLQFAPVEIPEIKPPEPSWFEKALSEVFRFLAELFAPLGQTLGASWWWLQWVLLTGVVLFVLVLLWRAFGNAAGGRGGASAGVTDEWQPERAASLALLEDADRLAAEGRFDEATHLLLQRSVGQIAAARPGWVEPSSTARELAALPALPEAARNAFRIIAERVERSLFALRALEKADWEAARAAYADFALARLTGQERAA
ncbi:hypothetical protein OIK40_09705 [Erythrobacter sp. sf7]|uniref:DUF4129 domain-containing protein n=1 Tax=Erythrobacter fulvus TaxID=2987523 RepID=A0ABT5JRW3_9SPHN|nr:hypothetical protein [Erythrobacter fulvus]MDC8754915.1 hypothetical protein [Erythrobacter fulvus]